MSSVEDFVIWMKNNIISRIQHIASPEIVEKTAQDWENYPTGLNALHLKAIRSILDKEDPSYKQ